jgi:hypothetical protein
MAKWSYKYVCCLRPYIRLPYVCGLPALFPDYLSVGLSMYRYNCLQPGQYDNLLEKTNVLSHSFINIACCWYPWLCMPESDSLIIKSTTGGTYVRCLLAAGIVFKVYIAAFSGIIAFLMWPNIILEFNRYTLWNINVIRATVSEEFRFITETDLH